MPNRPRIRRPGARHTLTIAIALALLAVGAYAWAIGPTKPPKAAAALTATLTIPDTIAIAGATPRLPWPAGGQAALYIKNIGDFGHVNQAITLSDTTAISRPIASVAKIMTAYLTLRAHPLRPGEDGPILTVTSAEASAYPREKAQGQSVVPVRAGETLTERQALIALMLPSANNIARILARWVSGSIPAFITTMNATAAALGMTDTRYTDPSGFDPRTVSTAGDQTCLADLALTIPAFAQITSTQKAEIPVAGQVRNVNRLLGKHGIDGVKTGSMGAAGGNLVFTASASIGGRRVRIIGAVLNQDKGLPQAFTQSQALVLAARTVIRPHTLVKAGQIVAMTSNRTPLRAATDITVLGWPGLRYRAALSLSMGTSITSGGIAGTLALDGLGDPATASLVAG